MTHAGLRNRTSFYQITTACSLAAEVSELETSSRRKAPCAVMLMPRGASCLHSKDESLTKINLL